MSFVLLYYVIHLMLYNNVELCVIYSGISVIEFLAYSARVLLNK